MYDFGKTTNKLKVDYLAHPEIDGKIRQFYDLDSEKELLDRLGCDFY